MKIFNRVMALTMIVLLVLLAFVITAPPARAEPDKIDRVDHILTCAAAMSHVEVMMEYTGNPSMAAIWMEEGYHYWVLASKEFPEFDADEIRELISPHYQHIRETMIEARDEGRFDDQWKIIVKLASECMQAVQ